MLREDYGTTERMPDLGYPRARHHLAFEFARFVCARPCCRQGLRRRTTARSSACTTGRPRSCSGSTSRRRRSARPAARRCSCCAQSSSVLWYGFVSCWPFLACANHLPPHCRNRATRTARCPAERACGPGLPVYLAPEALSPSSSPPSTHRPPSPPPRRRCLAHTEGGKAFVVASGDFGLRLVHHESLDRRCPTCTPWPTLAHLGGT